MLDTVKINHVQHISFTQSRLTDAVSVILSELLSYEHPSKALEALSSQLYLADTYRYSTGIPYPLMEQLVRIAGQAGIYEVIRQSDKDTLHEVVTKILQFC